MYSVIPGDSVYSKNGAVQHTVTTGYGTDGRISSAGFTHGGASKNFGYEYHRGSTLVAQRTYTYDILGRPTARNTARNGQTVNDSFGYNNRSKLTTATVGGNFYTYDYDNIGNRKTAQEATDAVTNYTANQLNQYTAISEDGDDDFLPEYDADGNLTCVKTSTGIWAITYDAENRPTDFTKIDSTGSTSVHCEYDYMGRRTTKMVTVDNNVTLWQRYIYRGYLQVACIDLTRSHHPALWYITWDPTQPIATRPLAIQKDGTWFTYGWDLTKNICELYGPSGYIRTAYTYSPYGQVTSTRDEEQPLQWSSEYNDTEPGLIYYNYRHYNPVDGRWIGRDIIGILGGLNVYGYNCLFSIESDWLGLVTNVNQLVNLVGDYEITDKCQLKESWCQKFAKAIELLIESDEIRDFSDFNKYFYEKDIASKVALNLAKKYNNIMTKLSIQKGVKLNISTKLPKNAQEIEKNSVGLKDEVLANGQQTARHFAGGLYAGEFATLIYGNTLDKGEYYWHVIKDKLQKNDSQRKYENKAEYKADMATVEALRTFRLKFKEEPYKFYRYDDAAWQQNKQRIAQLWRTKFCR